MKVKSYRRAMLEFERTYFTDLLKAFHGNVSHSAVAAGVARRTVQLKLVALKINAAKFRPRTKRARVTSRPK